VLLKNRSNGVFDPPLIGPYEFVRYKDEDKYAAILKSKEGTLLDCSVSHLVPIATY
jgi:hypothetical protein